MNLPTLALRRPRTTLVLALAATLAALPGLWRLELQTDGNALVPENDPAVREDRALRAEFGVRDPLFVVVPATAAAGVFDPVTLGRVVAVTRALEALPGVAPEDVLSLATLPGAGLRPGTFSPRPLLESAPTTAADAARVAQEAALLGLDDGLLVAADGRSTVVLVGVPPGVDRREFYQATRQAAERAAPNVDLAVVGAPVAETLLGHHVLADLGLPDSEVAGDRAEARPAVGGFGALRARVADGLGLLPLALAMMALVLAVSFRRPVAVAVPLGKIGCVLVLLFGTLGWLGVPFTLVTAVLPVLLTAVGLTDEIHLVRRLQELARDTPFADGPTLVSRALTELASPLIQTSVTTAVSLLSFAVSPIPPVRLFGLQAAFGVGLCLLWALTVSPALLALAPRRSWARGGDRGGAGFPRLAALAGRLSGQRPRHFAGMIGLGALVVLGGLSRLEVQDSWVDGFDPDSGFARVVRDFERDFRGLHRLLLALEAAPLELTGTLPAGALGANRELVLPSPPGLPAPERLVGAELELSAAGAGHWRAWVERAASRDGSIVLGLAEKSGSPWHGRPPAAEAPTRYRVRLRPFLVPAALARTRELEAHLADWPDVGRVMGPTPQVARAARLFSFFSAPSDDPSALPAEPSQALAAWSALGAGLGPARLGQLVDAENYSRVLITVVLHEARYAQVERLFKDLDRFAARRLAPAGITLRKGGDVAVSQALIRAVVTTQVGSLGLSVVGILLVAAWLGGSLGWGLRVIAAPCLAVALTFAAMGWAGITLGVATSMFAGMTLGVGVDSAIHLLARHRLLASRYSHPAQRVRAALTSVLPAITIDTVTVGLGFGVLLLSPVPANSRLAGLVMLTLGACWLATVTVVPALLGGRPSPRPFSAWWESRSRGRHRSAAGSPSNRASSSSSPSS